MVAVGWWSHRPGIDYLIAGSALGAYRVARSHGLDPLVVQSGPWRVEIYQGALGLAAAVLALAVVPAAIVLALTPGRRLRYLLRTHSDDLRHATVAAAGAALASLAISVGALAFDAGDSSNRLARNLAVFILAVVVLAAARLIDLFGLLLKNIGQDRSSDGHDPSVGPVHPLELPEAPEGIDLQLSAPAHHSPGHH
jgi:hypothetical protein